MHKHFWLLGLVIALTGCVTTPAPTSPANSPTIAAPTLVVATVSADHCHIRGVLPDPDCTPGATNSEVTQSNIASTICVSGWTKTIRPSASYADNLKQQQLVQYGYTDTNPANYEEDHLISLELGGNPTDPRNLWPEPRTGSPNATNKDKIENYLKAQVCRGSMTLSDAQKGIAGDWTQYLTAVSESVEDISSDDPDDNGE